VDPKTLALVKASERDLNIRIETRESYDHPTFWEVTAWMTRTAEYEKMTGKADRPRVWGRKYITTPTAGGMVLVIRNPQSNDTFITETWGDIPSYDSFVKKVLDRVKESPLYEDFTTLCDEANTVIPAG
jgi:hypothetical protein